MRLRDDPVGLGGTWGDMDFTRLWALFVSLGLAFGVAYLTSFIPWPGGSLWSRADRWLFHGCVIFFVQHVAAALGF